MRIYKYGVKALAAFLAVAVMAGGMPVSALAETNEETTKVIDEATETATDETTQTMITFADLPEETINQTVAYETAQEKLNLPDTLQVTLKATNEALTQTQEEQQTNEEEIEEEKIEEEKTEEEKTEDKTIENEIEASIEVTGWSCEPDYVPERAGTYCFTPQYTLADGQNVAEGVTAPVITVIVEENQEKNQEVYASLTSSVGNVTISGDISGDDGSYAGNGKGENGNILGGIGEPSGNTLIFDSSSGSITGYNDFSGGYAESNTDATNNTVTVNGGNFSDNIKIFGGNTIENSNATGNSINFKQFTGSIGAAFGGFAEGDCSNNQIIMSGGEVGKITGGRSYGVGGTSFNNTIIIKGGTVKQFILGGDSYGSSTNNTVTLSGSVNLNENVNIIGGEGYADCFSGNTLNLEQSGLNIAALGEFQYVNYVIPASVKANDTILTTSGGAFLNNKNDEYRESALYSTINISVDSESSLQIGDQVTLIDATGGHLYAAGINTTASDPTSGYEFALSVEDNKLIATVTNQSYQVNVTNGTGSGTYKSGDPVTIAAGTAPNGQIFDSWTSEDGVTFKNANNTTTSFTMPAKAVTVTANYKSKVEVTGMALNQTSADLKVGDTVALIAAITPSNVTDSSVIWNSSNTDIASVDQNGTVTAKGLGSAAIMVTSNSNASVSATCTVNVTANIVTATGLTLNQTNADLKVGDTVALSAAITPSNATDASVTWSSSDTDIATVDENGTVTCNGIGSANITATSKSNTGLTAICSINVSIGKVTSLMAKKNKTTSITLTWEKQNNVKGYVVYRYDSAKKKYV
ncbi:MAG: Ig domain-containing protein, partial [Lachnotalea sp.]